MTNSGIIEGHTGNSTGCSDLSLSISSCQSVPNPPMNVGDWATIGRAAKLPNGSMRVFHGAGTTEEENKAGRWTNIPDGDYLFGGSGATLRAVSLRKPAIEKEARLRPQHYFIFGSGETRMKMQNNSMAGGLLGFAPPRSRSLL